MVGGAARPGAQAISTAASGSAAAFTEDLKLDFSNLHLMWSAYVQVTGP